MLTNRPISCTTQPLSKEVPASDWGIERLGRHAAQIHERIERQEQTLAADYWLLGQTLNLARREFHHGQWQRFLAEHDIDKTRSSRAMAIFRSFNSPDDLETMTVKDAYAARKSSKPAMRHRTVNQQEANRRAQEDVHLPVTLRTFLANITTEGAKHADEVEFATEPESIDLLAKIEQALESLVHLRECLLAQVARLSGPTPFVANKTHHGDDLSDESPADFDLSSTASGLIANNQGNQHS